MEEKVFISINHWECGKTYPDTEPFITWMDDSSDDFDTSYLNNKKWVEENGLIVIVGLLDMSFSYNIIAPKLWVDKNIPQIYDYPKFIMKPDKDGKVHGIFNVPFPSDVTDPGIYFWVDEEECFEKIEKDSLFED